MLLKRSATLRGCFPGRFPLARARYSALVIVTQARNCANFQRFRSEGVTAPVLRASIHVCASVSTCIACTRSSRAWIFNRLKQGHRGERTGWI